MKSPLVWLSAVCVWLLAIAGAVGLSVALDLSTQDMLKLTGVVAVIAFFGALLPVLNLRRNIKS